jgi:hypothetical protein
VVYNWIPRFADPTTGVTFSDATKITQLKRYKLKSTSGLIKKGLNLASRFGTNVGKRDFWGNSIVGKSTFNIGAYEGSGTARPAFVLNTENLPIEAAENVASALRVFPNPLSSHSTISFVLQNSGKATILLYNLEGKLINPLFSGEVRAGEYKNLTLDAAGLANGMYVVRLFNGEKVITQKIVVRK